jgi:serine phosphatase RsbU (regulator of sigma subunit)
MRTQGRISRPRRFTAPRPDAGSRGGPPETAGEGEPTMHIVIRDEFKNVRSAEIGNAVDTVIVGSHPDCHVYLPDIRIANEHLRICRDPEGGWQLELGDIPEDTPAAFTRIFVNALEVANGTIVHHNDEILMATFALRVFTDDSDVHAPLASAMEDAAKIRAHPLPAGAIIRNEAEIETAIPVSRVREMTTFAFEMHDCPDLAALLAATITALAKRFHARLVWMGARRHGYGRMEYVESRLVDGRAGGDPPRLETYLFRCCERGQYVCCPSDDHDDVESVLAIPLYGSRAILGMVYIDRGSGDAAFGAEHLDLLTTMGFAIGRQLELIMREQIKLHEAIAAGELSFMRELQSVMDPSNVPQWDGLQLAVYCKPGLDSAGDIYDVMRLPNGLASFFCGKVTGSPTTAALAMAEVRSAFRFAGLHADPPHVLLRALNWLLHDPRHPAALSAVGVVMNPKTGAMQFATAGEIGALVVGDRGQVRSLRTTGTPPVGAEKDREYTSSAGRLLEGESIILFTPGCLTVTDAKGRPLGAERFLDAVADGFGQSASVALTDLLSDLGAFFKEGRQPDDITLVVLHRE